MCVFMSLTDCGQPPHILHGTVKVGSSTTYLSEALFTCDTGYSTNKAILACMETGEWETSSCEGDGMNIFIDTYTCMTHARICILHESLSL